LNKASFFLFFSLALRPLLSQQGRSFAVASAGTAAAAGAIPHDDVLSASKPCQTKVTAQQSERTKMMLDRRGAPSSLGVIGHFQKF
jgi:hypothetical protein